MLGLATDDATIERLLAEATALFPRQSGAIGGYSIHTRDRFDFLIVVEAAMPTVARTVAVTALRNALAAAGVATNRTSEWAELVLDLDPRPSGVRRFEASDLEPTTTGTGRPTR